MASDRPTHDAAIAGTKIDPLDPSVKAATDTHSAVGDENTLDKTHIAPLTDEHSKHLDSVIGGTAAPKSSLAETAQNIATKTGEVAEQVRDTVVNAAQQAYDAVAGKK